jgi:5-methylcytosine-specific restriction endonuclease McrA
MADFSEDTKTTAFGRAGSRCQCMRQGHGHDGRRCNVALTRGTTHFHHITAESVGGSNALSNCEVLCMKCHQATQSYGRR